MKRILGKILAVTLLSGVCYGDDYDDAGLAYDKKDYKKAFKLYSTTCDNGDSRGCAMMGVQYVYGLGVPKNNQLALDNYSKACDMGHENACKLHTELQEAMPVCTESEISFLNDKRYFEVSSTADKTFLSILADSKTIQIDKKNKTIKVWTIWLASQKGRDESIKNVGKYDNYDNFGYRKYLFIINYGAMKSKTNSISENNCDGSIILSNDKPSEWRDIQPESVMEGIMESIKKKYNLK